MNQLMIITFMPHGMCYLWKPGLVGLHLVSDGMIALAYFSISITLVYILRQREDIPFDAIFLLFAAFILCCGAGHAFDIWTLWHPNYWVSGGLRLLTALVSCATAIALIVKIPEILTLPSPTLVNKINQQLEEKIASLEQQEAIIRQQEEFLRSIYDNVQEAIFVVDLEADGTFRYQAFNPAAIRLTGITDGINKTPDEILPAEFASSLKQRYLQCVTSQVTISYEECLPFRGQDTWWLTTLHPLKNNEGEIYRLVGTSLNFSDRKEAETKLEKERLFIKAILNNLSDGIVACDHNGILALFNQASQEFFATPQQPLPPEKWAEHYHLYDSQGHKYLKQEEIPLVRAFAGESLLDVELMTIPPNGKSRVLLANGSPIIDSEGNKLGAVVVVQDITERRQAEQALAQLNEELEERVKQRTQELEEVNILLFTTADTLEKRNQELDQFAYVASHDLKAPLRAIANLAQWLYEDLADQLNGDHRHNLDLLQSRVHRLENLINGLLDYSRVGRQSAKPQLVNVGEMLADIIDLLDVPDSCQIEIQENMPIFVTKAIPLEQVFRNLISNAINHSGSEHSKINISFQELADDYEFAVSDNGIGIDPRYHERIFTIFQTLEARDTKESTGIGLAIVKKAVENQGGKIKLESVVGSGSTFSFTWQKSQENSAN